MERCPARASPSSLQHAGGWVSSRLWASMSYCTVQEGKTSYAQKYPCIFVYSRQFEVRRFPNGKKEGQIQQYLVTLFLSPKGTSSKRVIWTSQGIRGPLSVHDRLQFDLFDLGTGLQATRRHEKSYLLMELWGQGLSWSDRRYRAWPTYTPAPSPQHCVCFRCLHTHALLYIGGEV